MEKFTLHILGCGSALPTGLHMPSAQVLSLRERLYMIDCGEGAQLQMRRAGLKFSRLGSLPGVDRLDFHLFAPWPHNAVAGVCPG